MCVAPEYNITSLNFDTLLVYDGASYIYISTYTFLNLDQYFEYFNQFNFS